MARKRLSDLLREEVQRSPDEELTSEKTGSSSSAESQKGTGARNRKPSPDAAAAKAKTSKSPKESAAPEADAPSAAVDAESAEIMTALRETIETLQADLQHCRRAEANLRDEMATLETSLRDQKAIVQRLKTELEQAQSGRELEEARQTILSLSDHNLKMKQELETLKSTISKPQRMATTPSAFRELRQILQHPIQVDLPSTALSDADIGWVD